MVRGVPIVFFASFFAIENNVNLLLISITSLAVLLYTSFTKRLYKKMYGTILRNLCFLNLGMLGIGPFYIRAAGGNQGALVTTYFYWDCFPGILCNHSLCSRNTI